MAVKRRIPTRKAVKPVFRTAVKPALRIGVKAPCTDARTAHVLDVPFEARFLAGKLGAPWDAVAKACVYRGDEIPLMLRDYASKPWSWERFVEDGLNGRATPASVPSKAITLRPHQSEAAVAICAAERAGRKGFLLADEVGLGKTLSAWKAVLSMQGGQTDGRRVLVVAPLAVLAHWRQTIGWLGDGGMDIVVINYDRLQKLFEANPDAARPAKSLKGKARQGKATDFDVIIWDESHRLQHPDSARSKFAVKLNANAGFVIWMSATAGQTPLGLSYLAPLLAQVTGSSASDLKEFEKWCRDNGFGVSTEKYGKWVWSGAVEDIRRMHALLFTTPPGRPLVGMRRRPQDIAGWPEMSRVLFPVALSAEENGLYRAAWTEFRALVGLPGYARDPKGALAARLRFRQKCSMVRVTSTVQLVTELLDTGRQVAVSVAFRDTLSALLEAFAKAGHPAAQVHGGQSAGDKEAERMCFQRGDNRVVLFTPTEGISLHQGEHNDAPRSLVVHDLRWSAIDMAQVEGRCHRDGKYSQSYWMLAPGTVDEDIARVVLGRMRSMRDLAGDETSTLDAIEAVLLRLTA